MRDGFQSLEAHFGNYFIQLGYDLRVDFFFSYTTVGDHMKDIILGGIKFPRGGISKSAATVDRMVQRVLDGVVYHADLRNADLKDADLRCCDFRNANLTNADLRGARASEARFEGCKLEGAKGFEAATSRT